MGIMVARQYLAPFFWCVLFFCSLLGMVVFRHANAAEAGSSTGTWRRASDTLELLPAVLESNVYAFLTLLCPRLLCNVEFWLAWWDGERPSVSGFSFRGL